MRRKKKGHNFTRTTRRRTTKRQGRRRRHLIPILLLFLFVCLLFSTCSGHKDKDLSPSPASTESTLSPSLSSESEDEFTPAKEEEKAQKTPSVKKRFARYRKQNPLPEYDGRAVAVINNNHPFFTDLEMTDLSGESYAKFDKLGRCGSCYALVDQTTMPGQEEERGPIGNVRPTGWHTVKYEGIDGNYLYNRCHLIGWQLTGQNDNQRNLITGTRYMNVEGMEPYENAIAAYVRETGGSVLYRVTPIFKGDNLIADGVLLEAIAKNPDSGEKAPLSFCVFCYNVQPGIVIDYATGDSSMDTSKSMPEDPANQDTVPSNTGSGKNSAKGKDGKKTDKSSGKGSASNGEREAKDISEKVTYVGNANTGKFHKPDCSSVKDMADHNMVLFYGGREEVIEKGYQACKRCNP